MTILECLTVMAYNVGREHEKRQVMTLEEGRVNVLNILALVEDIDPGDLAKEWPKEAGSPG